LNDLTPLKRLKRVKDNGSARELVELFRSPAAHPRPLAGGGYYCDIHKK
jgi:hypothetical protein